MTLGQGRLKELRGERNVPLGDFCDFSTMGFSWFTVFLSGNMWVKKDAVGGSHNLTAIQNIVWWGKYIQVANMPLDYDPRMRWWFLHSKNGSTQKLSHQHLLRATGPHAWGCASPDRQPLP